MAKDNGDNKHIHKCALPMCGTTWSHTENEAQRVGEEQGAAAYRKLHSCPKCGNEQYWKYSEEGDPDDAGLTPEQLERKHQELNTIAPGGKQLSVFQRLLAGMVVDKYRK